MTLLHKLLLFSACLCSAAQEPSKLPDAHESDRKAYDEIYAKSSDVFSAAPNAFMMRVITGRKPGRALDVAMGTGSQCTMASLARMGCYRVRHFSCWNRSRPEGG